MTVGSMHRYSTDTEYSSYYCGIGDSTTQHARDRIGSYDKNISWRIGSYDKNIHGSPPSAVRGAILRIRNRLSRYVTVVTPHTYDT